jgi:hypothetical protein
MGRKKFVTREINGIQRMRKNVAHVVPVEKFYLSLTLFCDKLIGYRGCRDKDDGIET